MNSRIELKKRTLRLIKYMREGYHVFHDDGMFDVEDVGWSMSWTLSDIQPLFDAGLIEWNDAGTIRLTHTGYHSDIS